MLCMAGQVNAQVPDLTAGELPVNAGVWINLGPTGVQAWVYRGIEGGPTPDTGLSRQFQVKTIEGGVSGSGGPGGRRRDSWSGWHRRDPCEFHIRCTEYLAMPSAMRKPVAPPR